VNQHHYGLAIGISRYPGVSDLNGPVVDASAFHDWMVGDGLVPPGNTTLLTSPDPAVTFPDADAGVPIKQQVDIALRRLHTKARADIDNDRDRWRASRLYLYVAGHGIMPNGGEAALLFANAQPGMYDNLELGAYLAWYKQTGIFSEVVVLADCCRNWFPQVPASVVPFDDPPEPGSRVFSLVGYAAGPGDPAYEQIEDGVPPDERRGYFTTAVLAGLRGAAALDGPPYNCITSTTLARYVSVAVAQATAGKRVPQEVQMPDEPARPIKFGQDAHHIAPPPVPTYRVRITFPGGWAAPVELLTASSGRLPYAGAPAPWVLDLPAGLYGVYLAGSWQTTGLHEPTFTVTEDRDVQL
jgi:hypothetical protein